METVEWVFRHAGNCLIEVPPLELPTPPDRSSLVAWVATLWPDATSNNGWSALAWSKADRGWGSPAISPSVMSSSSASPPSTRGRHHRRGLRAPLVRVGRLLHRSRPHRRGSLSARPGGR